MHPCLGGPVVLVKNEVSQGSYRKRLRPKDMKILQWNDLDLKCSQDKLLVV